MINTAPRLTPMDGKVVTPVGFLDNALSVTVASDGSILVGGITDRRSVILRYDSAGRPDDRFSDDGLATGTFGWPLGMAVQSDGKVLVAGRTDNSNTSEFAVWRFRADGTPDTAFGSDGTGRVTTDFGPGPEVATVVSVQPDGKILVGGYRDIAGRPFALARYEVDGRLDDSFDGDGKVTTNLVSGGELRHELAVQPDGKILLGGSVQVGSTTQFALVRYSTDGSLDAGFSGDGIVVTPVGPVYAAVNALALQPDGKILLAGNSWNGSSDDFVVVRYTASGDLDTSFSGDGKATTDLAGRRDVAYGVVALPDGKILLGGSSGDPAFADFTLVRYDAAGELDTSYSGDGVVTTWLSSLPPVGFAYQSDGKVVLAGTTFDDTRRSITLARYTAEGDLDNRFGNPIFDGTGVALDPTVIVRDAELRAANSYEGATLTIMRNGGPDPHDVFGLASGYSDLVEGKDLISYLFLSRGSAVATVTRNSGGVLVLTFGSGANQREVDALMQRIVYADTSFTPAPEVTLDWTFSDGNTGAQGTGGPLAATATRTLSITSAGPNRMVGGSGDDIFVVNDIGDRILKDYSRSVDTVYSWIDFGLGGSNLENLTLLGTARTGIGNIESNEMRGNAADNYLDGQFNDDFLDGGAGADVMFGGPGNDGFVVDDIGDLAIEAPGEGSDTVYAFIDYQLVPTLENLFLFGNAVRGTGNDVDNKIVGNAHGNVLVGLGGNDLLDGGAGADVMFGGTDHDTYYVDDAGDLVLEADDEGTDTVISSIDYQLVPTLENLTVVGTAIGAYGNGGANVIIGNAQANSIWGFAGDDTLTGGAGSDDFGFDPGHGRDVVTDFTTTGPQADVLQFSTSLFANYAAAMSASAQVGADVVITTGADSSVTLQNVQLAALSSESFRFAA